jgi:adenylate cyclase
MSQTPPSRRDPRRRCGGLLAADWGGRGRYSPTFKAIRAELFDPTIAAHNGRIVKPTGDGLLVEFSRVVGALRCATELQGGMAQSNAWIASDRRTDFRIGSNVRAVSVEDGDIFRRWRERAPAPDEL